MKAGWWMDGWKMLFEQIKNLASSSLGVRGG
jgi:hypothetical protein